MILVPMEAKLVAALPDEPGWQFEPKWDGFRALVFRDGAHVDILSKSGKSLARYFPEIVAPVDSVAEQQFVLDGELLLPVNDVLSFDTLQARLHPAESRIAKLSRDTPAQLMLFDCLQTGGNDLLAKPLAERRGTLEPCRLHIGNRSCRPRRPGRQACAVVEAPGFTGKAPGGPSRWNDGHESEWEPLRNELVVEVLYDQVTGARFRHGTRLLRRRPDKAPAQCTMDRLVEAQVDAHVRGWDKTSAHAPVWIRVATAGTRRNKRVDGGR